MSELTKSSPRGHITQGSVVDNVPWKLDCPPPGIVLSNICDLENDKARFLLVAALLPAYSIIHSTIEFKAIFEADIPVRRKQWDDLHRRIKAWIVNDDIKRYFFLIADDINIEPLVVDFQHLISMPIEDIDDLVLLADLRQPDRDKMISNFAAYLSRIGVNRPTEYEMDVIIREMALPLYPSDKEL